MTNLANPTTAFIEISPNCNFNCSFCFSKFKSKKFLSLSEIKVICKRLKELEFEEVILFGGEPTVHKKLGEIIKTAFDNGFKVKMVSNGYRISNDLLKYFKYLDAISISVHGKVHHDEIVKVPGAFSRVFENIKKISEVCPSTGLLFSPTSQNLNEIFETASLFSDYISYFGINRIIRAEESKLLDNKIHYLINEAKRISKELGIISNIAHSFPYCKLRNISDIKFISSCKAGINSIAISNEGSIKICSASDLSVGNIFDYDLYNDEFYEYRKLSWLPEKCKKCKYLGQCFAGCKFSISPNYYCGDVLIEQEEV